MPFVHVAVEKETTFQGRTERWSNVYTYDVEDKSVGPMQALEDAVLAAERPVHGAAVAFKQTKTYTTDGLNAGEPGHMINITDRSVAGTGANTGTGTLYKECAILVKWPLPRKTLLGVGIGRQRSLKKWIHPGEVTHLTSNSLTGVNPLSTAEKAPFLTYAAAVRTAASGELCSPADGAQPNQTANIHPYVEHRQFPRGRKEDT